MPLYEFRCERCENQVTQLVRGDFRPESVPCNKCGGFCQKVPSAPSSPVIKGFNAKNGYSKK